MYTSCAFILPSTVPCATDAFGPEYTLCLELFFEHFSNFQPGLSGAMNNVTKVAVASQGISVSKPRI